MLRTESKSITCDIIHVVGGTCDHCGRDLECKWGSSIINSGPNNELFSDVLAFTLYSQHNGYSDGIDAHVMLCRECTDLLCSLFPCFVRAIKEIPK